TLNEAEVLQRASPCIPDRHSRLKFGLTQVIPATRCFPIMPLATPLGDSSVPEHRAETDDRRALIHRHAPILARPHRESLEAAVAGELRQAREIGSGHLRIL